jgi:uncharacterized membrane protein YkoI
VRFCAVVLTAGLAAAAVEARPGDRFLAQPGLAAQAVQENDRDDRGARRGRNEDGAGPYIPLESIIGSIQARVPGRLVGVRGPNGAGHYRIIWETPDGRVITFIVDARTGQILR